MPLKFDLNVNANNALSKSLYLAEKNEQPDKTVDEFGNTIWLLNGRRHRVGLPAIEFGDGSVAYYVHGRLHRTDGPAIEYDGGAKEYWVNGMFLRRES